MAEAWLAAGIRLIQLRAKSATMGPMLELADELVRIARDAGAILIVNDRADVARLSGADGVHIGQTDLSVGEVRGMLAPDAIVGLSTHGADQAAAACRLPISYLAIGPVHETATKAQPDPVVGIPGVRDAARHARASGIPLVAIGGITIARAPAVLAAGASSVAVASDLVGDDPAERARRWLEALSA